VTEKPDRDSFDDWVEIAPEEYRDVVVYSKQRCAMKILDKRIDKSRKSWELVCQGECSEQYVSDILGVPRNKRVIHAGGDKGWDLVWREFRMNIKSTRRYGCALVQPAKEDFLKGDIIVGVEFYKFGDYGKGRIFGMCSTKKARSCIIPAKEYEPRWTGWALEQEHFTAVDRVESMI
jgi:hypothetical protein